MVEGWNWLTYAKQGKVIRLGEPWLKTWLRRILQWLPWPRLRLFLEHSKQDATWAIVQIHYQSADGTTRGIYQGKVSLKGQVQTAIRSEVPLRLVPVYQYQVTDLVRIIES
jgi:hypothetical protein